MIKNQGPCDSHDQLSGHCHMEKKCVYIVKKKLHIFTFFYIVKKYDILRINLFPSLKGKNDEFTELSGTLFTKRPLTTAFVNVSVKFSPKIMVFVKPL
jgi:hypothetical protein